MKITCLINDHYPGTSNPLIYTVEVDNPEDHDEVMEAVAAERLADIGELKEGDNLDLELLMAFEGDPKIVSDWRE